jgi:hypothetical protein
MNIRALIFVLSICVAVQAHAQTFEIGIVDFFGLGNLPESEVRAALTLEEGDTMSIEDMRAARSASENRIEQLPDVAEAQIALVCCEQQRMIVYVGVRRTGEASMNLRAAPTGQASLAPEIVAAGQDFSKALSDSVRRGDTAEDVSQGHSMAKNDQAVRAVQERFLIFARDPAPLRNVLREASDPQQRALAAQVIAYAPDKKAVVDDLVFALADVDANVRNNAIRGLGVLALAANQSNASLPPLPIEPFADFMRSVTWTDRNKAAMVLMSLAETRDPQVLAQLKARALTPLIEMARWKSPGHALPAIQILGRIAALPPEQINIANRETVIRMATSRPSRPP